jgi:hypothetical protein
MAVPVPDQCGIATIPALASRPTGPARPSDCRADTSDRRAATPSTATCRYVLVLALGDCCVQCRPVPLDLLNRVVLVLSGRGIQYAMVRRTEKR